ncbi:MAG: response regulator [Herpetosiphon sp.]
MTKTIVVIDDDLHLQMVLEIAFRDAGYSVVSAMNGQEGLDRLETLVPDLVISDVMMPQVDGVQFFNAIKERLQGQGVPMIFMTALARKPWFGELESEGAVFLQKPFNMDELLDLIRLLLDDESTGSGLH